MKECKMFNGKELRVGEVIKFADLWQSDEGDVEELLESGCVWVANGENDEPLVADFIILMKDTEKLINTLVKVICIC